ncbi:MAG: glycosyltransferase, partial [Acidobacteriota bacterium]
EPAVRGQAHPLRVGGAEDQIADGRSGILTAPGDVAALARGIRRLLDFPDLRNSMASEARRKIEASFSLEVVAASYRRLYETLIREAARSGRRRAAIP